LLNILANIDCLEMLMGDQREFDLGQGWQQMGIANLRDVSQLCAKQVGTGEIIK